MKFAQMEALDDCISRPGQAAQARLETSLGQQHRVLAVIERAEVGIHGGVHTYRALEPPIGLEVGHNDPSSTLTFQEALGPILGTTTKGVWPKKADRLACSK